ncbi:MAG: signal peptidase I [Pseudomonadales bacterium]|nr:signal peptidase I [Pseudomonadales bacterium]
MDFNFPLILMCLVFGGAFIWLLDIFWFSKQRGPDEAESFIIENAKSLTPVLAFVFVIRSFLYEPFQIPSGSMEQTLLVGDFILVNKYTYGIRLPVWRDKIVDINQPERGDVMVFFPPHKDQYYIKRVVGIPGDLVEYKNKILIINGEVQQQTPIAGKKRALFRQSIEKLGVIEHNIQINTASQRNDDITVRVPDGHYFMMGDNRDNSQDSRFWGPVSEQRIVGKAVAIWMHKKPGWHFPTFNRAGSFQ